MMIEHSSAAVESAVDAYASRVLSDASPAEACVDDSLGPYVTSLLRCSLHEMDVSSIPEFDSLLELLEEHCSLSEEAATAALTTIAAAVRTGIVPEPNRSVRNSAYHVDADTLFSMTAAGNTEEPLAQDEFPPLSEAQNQTQESAEKDASGTPLKEDRLIPVDLLGALDDPSSPPEEQSRQVENTTRQDETFPPLGAATPQVPKRHASGGAKSGKKSSKKQPAEDLAAVLFRSSRVRQSSIDSDNVSKSTSAGSGAHVENLNNQYFQQQWDMSVEMLLSMNPDLGEEAAAEAALIANADPNVAQHVINQALMAPPVCRHMLNDHCYRSDCQFSHDVEGHTCLFWIRGRCGKGPSCRFLHGFSDKALEGIQQVPMDHTTLSPRASSAPVAIATGNLVTHNMNAAFSAPQHEGSPFSNFQPTSSGFDTGSFSMPSSWAATSSLETVMHVDDQARGQAANNGESSFASIASKGYSGASFTPESSKSAVTPISWSSQLANEKEKTVRIPQELWNPHVNRDAHLFHIPDPMERYEAVSASVSRPDVIDLHFQVSI